MKTTITIFLIILSFGEVFPQKERNSIRKGNKEYLAGNFVGAETNYKHALALDPNSFEAFFNLGNAFYQQGKYEEAAEVFEKLILDKSDPVKQSKIYHNLGNSLLKANKLEETIEAYKKALRINPNDSDTRYNLVYAIHKLKAQQNEQPEPPTERIMDKILEEEERVQQKLIQKEVKSSSMQKDW